MRRSIYLTSGTTSSPFEKCGMPNICKAFEELRNVLIYNNGHLVLCQESGLVADGFMACVNSPQAWRAEMGERSSGQMLYIIFGNKYANRAIGFYFSISSIP